MSEAIIRRALSADADTVAQLWESAAAWLAHIGTDQWQYPLRRNAIGDAIETDTCRLVLAQARGEDLGSAVLDWVSLTAQAAAKRWLRLDAWTANTKLHRYYLTRLRTRPHDRRRGHRVRCTLPASSRPNAQP